MENASKALIIAGAILLSILIISLGIMIFNQASGVVDSNSMDEVAIKSFNEKFTQYEGTNIRGAQVNSLINTIVQNNISNSNDKSKQVSIEFENIGSTSEYWSQPMGGTIINPTSTSTIGKALTGKNYVIQCDSDTATGYITKIKISR